MLVLALHETNFGAENPKLYCGIRERVIDTHSRRDEMSALLTLIEELLENKLVMDKTRCNSKEAGPESYAILISKAR